MGGDSYVGGNLPPGNDWKYGCGYIIRRNETYIIVELFSADKSRQATNVHVGSAWKGWEAIALNSDMVDFTFLDSIQLSTEAAVNTYYNTVSSSLMNNTWYRRVVSHGITHSVLSGGIYYLEGFKVTSDYEWQKITSYGRIFYRSKSNGSWTSWTAK